MAERRLERAWIEAVLHRPQHLFYDLHTQSLVAIGEVDAPYGRTYLVVVFTVERESVKIITVYPCRRIEREIRTKEGRRWVRIK